MAFQDTGILGVQMSLKLRQDNRMSARFIDSGCDHCVMSWTILSVNFQINVENTA